jgi:hypothetical protein
MSRMPVTGIRRGRAANLALSFLLSVVGVQSQRNATVKRRRFSADFTLLAHYVVI